MKKEDVACQIDELLEQFKESALRKLDQVYSSGVVPEHFKQEGTYYLAKAVIDSLCRDRPVKPLHDDTRKEFDNLHLFM